MARNNRTIFDLGREIAAWRSRNPDATCWIDAFPRRIRRFGAPILQNTTFPAVVAFIQEARASGMFDDITLYANPTQRQLIETLESENRMPPAWVNQETEIVVNGVQLRRAITTVELREDIPPDQVHVHQGDPSQGIVINNLQPYDDTLEDEGALQGQAPPLITEAGVLAGNHRYPLPDDYVSMESVRLNMAERMNNEGVGFAGMTLEEWHQMWADAERVGMRTFEHLTEIAEAQGDLRALLAGLRQCLRYAVERGEVEDEGCEEPSDPEEAQRLEAGVISEGHRAEKDFTSYKKTGRSVGVDDLDDLFAEIDKVIEGKD